MQSPNVSKPADNPLTTIGEEKSGEGELTFCDKLNMACGNPTQPIPRTMSKAQSDQLSNQLFDFNGIDWMAQQNGNQFDPQLFDDYREPQESILSGEALGNDSFFSDAFAFPDFQTPISMGPSPAPPKTDLLAQIDQLQEEEEVVPAEDKSKLLNCNTIWYVPPLLLLEQDSIANNHLRDRLQACPKVKEGDFDLDLLCKDLQKKARCSETGAVVNESDFNNVLMSHVGKKNTTGQVYKNATNESDLLM